MWRGRRGELATNNSQPQKANIFESWRKSGESENSLQMNPEWILEGNHFNFTLGQGQDDYKEGFRPGWAWPWGSQRRNEKRAVGRVQVRWESRGNWCTVAGGGKASETLGETCGQARGHMVVLPWNWDEKRWVPAWAWGREGMCYVDREGGGGTRFQLVITSLGFWAEKIRKCPLIWGRVKTEGNMGHC